MPSPPWGGATSVILPGMRLSARFYAAFTALLCVGLGLMAMPMPGVSQSTPAEVTTDTPQYCLTLLDRVSELVRASIHPPDEVTSLSAEGQRMCDQGQTRGGIMRLRRALVLLRQSGGP
jgi:hypothetical protein